MLAAAALRLAAVESLCPTGALAGTVPFPTLAKGRVFDSQMIGAEAIDPDEDYTPSLSIFTEDVHVERQGDVSTSMHGRATAKLIVIVELGCTQSEEGGDFVVVPYGEDDPRARMVLDALCAQVRLVLAYSPSGSIFRKIVGSVDNLRIEPFALPQFDIRWMRSTMTFSCMIRDDKFTDEPGLPEPLRSLFLALPDGSTAKAKLQELHDVFAGITRDPLADIRISTTGNPVTQPEGSV